MDGRRPFLEDLVFDILLRLPVESLLRFKCVSKHWYALIKSPSFVEKHFHHKNKCARLLICNFKAEEKEQTLVKSVVFSLLPEKIVPGVTPEQKIILHLPRVFDYMCVGGPVAGLFLLQENFYGDGVCLGLWNPATIEFRPLPPVPFKIDQIFHDNHSALGLGYDLLTQDYKVVWIRLFLFNRVQRTSPHFYVCVYSSCDNSWKNLQFPSSYTSGFPFDATYLNGVFYWCSLGIDKMCRIHSFDMRSEQFGEMQLPYIPNEQWKKLTLHGDSLAMLAANNAMTSIYELKQEGCLSKVVTVQPRIDPHCPRGIWENDKIIFEIN